ncbi:hypothetical protein BaRGS_00005759 [Batillaria attramentaria]|uniref:Uncharacterized protein n=1 Tax=Batillaria attramentaria TaxID=370345 RepID=A0ABD0LVG8_9CAEN
MPSRKNIAKGNKKRKKRKNLRSVIPIFLQRYVFAALSTASSVVSQSCACPPTSCTSSACEKSMHLFSASLDGHTLSAALSQTLTAPCCARETLAELQ